MAGTRTWSDRLSTLNTFEKTAIAGSAVLASFLIIDPLVLGVVRGFHPEVRQFFRALTDLGRSNWLLIPSGLGILVLGWLRVRDMRLRRSVAYGYAAQLLIFLFAAISLSGLSASLAKNILGRARPKLFDTLGSLEFQPFAFDSDFASFPSGHATTAGALAGVLIIVWPGARVPVICAAAWVAASRFLIGSHYFSDALAGFAFGIAFTYFLRGPLASRRWLFERDRAGVVRLRGRALMDAAARAISSRAAALRPDGFSQELPPRQ